MFLAALRVLRRFPLLSACVTAPGKGDSMCATPLIFVGNNENLPMTVKITTLLGTYGSEYNLLAAAAFLLMFVPLAVFFSLQRYFVQGLLAGSVK